MSSWMYYNKTGERIGPISTQTLEELVRLGLITRKTKLENSDGDVIVAGNVDLPFPGPPSQDVPIETGGDSNLNDTKMSWSVKTGKLNTDEWGAEVSFRSVEEPTWSKIRDLAKSYAKARVHLRSCPSISVSNSEKKLVFPLGRFSGKPMLIAESKNISSAQCAAYRDQLIEGAEIFHRYHLGLGMLDRRLMWQIEGGFRFIPAFWLPAPGNLETPQAGMPPEYVGAAPPTPSQTGDIYAIASFCFRVLTGKEYDPTRPVLVGDLRSDLKDWDTVLDPALRILPVRRPASFREWKETWSRQKTAAPDPSPLGDPAPSKPTAVYVAQPVSTKNRSRRNGILIFAAFIVLVLVLRSVAPGVMRSVPLLNIIVPAAYQRGIGSYVVHYADRTYDRTKWEMAWSLKNLNTGFFDGVPDEIMGDILVSIAGWDSGNLAVGVASGKGVVLRDKHWFVYGRSFNDPYYVNANTFYAKDGRDWIRVVLSTNSVENINSEHLDKYSFCQLEHNFFQIFGGDVLYESKNDRFSEVADDEKKVWIWDEDGKNTDDVVARQLQVGQFRSFRTGRALACLPGGRIVHHKDDLWHDLHENSTDAIEDIWVMNEKNFILVGGKKIVRYRNGKRDQPVVSSSLDTLENDYVAVWGVDMNNFWILDMKGNVIQFKNNGVRIVIRGPKLGVDRFRDAWVSPEGVVYAITGKDIYRLD